LAISTLLLEVPLLQGVHLALERVDLRQSERLRREMHLHLTLRNLTSFFVLQLVLEEVQDMRLDGYLRIQNVLSII